MYDAIHVEVEVVELWDPILGNELGNQGISEDELVENTVGMYESFPLAQPSESARNTHRCS